MRTTLKLVLGIATAVGIGGFAYFPYRNIVMQRLYAEAAGNPPQLRGSAESTAAIRKLAGYRGQKATEMLLYLAMGNGAAQAMWPETRAEAIKALGKRRDPAVALTLAKLQQPHEGFGTRQAAASALKELPCSDECIRLVLHYLERVWRGDPNHEDRWVEPSNGGGTADLKKQEQALYNDLYAVVRGEKTEALTNLAAVYGLGSADPSPFALDLVSRLDLPEACPYLQESARRLKGLSAQFYNGPRQELQTAIASLNCR